ncbi:hypothetical protein TeGR_g2479 [Tetraparma gracilis]|uniref:Uncharacterized protein n=1 Tax=Tetraparma gracilis TaxID=2962635 RepID=A0ABQ6MSC8_9STRA|nr:hypothetical protein TeGR_g2479 [Tetraparma gracilis]
MSVADTAWLDTIYSVTKLVFTVPITYMCSKGSIPYHMTWMVALSGVSMLVMALPGLMKAVAEEGNDSQYTCKLPLLADDESEGARFLSSTDKLGAWLSENSPSNFMSPEEMDRYLLLDECEAADGGGRMYFYLMCISQMLAGIGFACPYSLGPAHINANASPEVASRLCGNVYAVYVIGMGVGFIGGGMFLNNGNWWMGFVLNAIMTFALVPFFMRLPAVPEKHKDTAVHNEIRSVTERSLKPSARSTRVSDSSSSVTSQRRPSSLGAVSVQAFEVMDFRHQVQFILLSPATGFTAVSAACEIFMITTMTSNGPQFLLEYTNNPNAVLLAGIAVLPGVFSAFLSMCIAGLIYVTASCPTEEIVGVDYVDGVATSMVDPPWVAEAGCAACYNPADVPEGTKPGASYMPVCYNKTTYFSPCHLGCVDWDDDEKMILASNCSYTVGRGNATDEFNPLDSPDSPYHGEYIVKEGWCPEQQCSSMGIILLLMFLYLALTFTNNVPMNIVMMRAVPTEMSGLSLACLDIWGKVLGDIPGTLIIGVLFDKAGLIQNLLTDPISCETMQSWAIFDIETLKFYMFVMNGVVPKVFSFIFAVLAWNYITKDPELSEPYEKTTTKTGNFRRVSKANIELMHGSKPSQGHTPTVESVKEGEEEEEA